MRTKRISMLAAGATAVLVLGGCSSAGDAGGAASSSAPVIGGSYSSTTALLNALTAAGIPCTSPSTVAGAKVAGAQGLVDCSSPSGAGSDSVASVFDSHADAQAYATRMIDFTSNNMSGSGKVTQVVVGDNWAVNTVPPYGDEVVAHLGGSESTASAPAATSAPTSAAAPASTAQAPTAQVTTSAAAPAAPTPTTQAPQPAQTTAQPQGCYPLTNGGNCYEPGEYCRTSDHGVSGVDGNGDAIKCEDNNGWRWERV